MCRSSPAGTYLKANYSHVFIVTSRTASEESTGKKYHATKTISHNLETVFKYMFINLE